MVPETGLEPAHQMAYAPKAYVYTNFTTRARYARPTLPNGLALHLPDVAERARYTL